MAWAAVAIDEINAAGGVLGRPLELVIRDHRGNPARGVDNIEAFAGMTDLIAVMSGIHTPVAMAADFKDDIIKPFDISHVLKIIQDTLG